MTDLVLDTSVIVASLVPFDRNFTRGQRIIEAVLRGRFVGVTSTAVPAEMAGAIARRTQDARVARAAADSLERWVELGHLRLMPLTRARMREAVRLAIELRISGADAIVLQLCDQRWPIASFDEELRKRADQIVRFLSDEDVEAVLG